MSEVVLQAVRKILHDYDQVALTLKVVREALSLVSNQKQVTIRVHPEQVQAVRDQIARVHKDFPEIGYLEISADARLDQGGCILETEVGIIDASLDGQLEALSLAMSSALEKRGEQQARLAGANAAVSADAVAAMELSEGDLLLLQREVPEEQCLRAAKAMRAAGARVASRCARSCLS